MARAIDSRLLAWTRMRNRDDIEEGLGRGHRHDAPHRSYPPRASGPGAPARRSPGSAGRRFAATGPGAKSLPNSSLAALSPSTQTETARRTSPAGRNRPWAMDIWRMASISAVVPSTVTSRSRPLQAAGAEPTMTGATWRTARLRSNARASSRVRSRGVCPEQRRRTAGGLGAAGQHDQQMRAQRGELLRSRSAGPPLPARSAAPPPPRRWPWPAASAPCAEDSPRSGAESKADDVTHAHDSSQLRIGCPRCGRPSCAPGGGLRRPSSGSWVTITSVMPSRLRPSMISITSWPEARSRLPVGSSARMMAGCMMVARAMATRWRWPAGELIRAVPGPVASPRRGQGLGHPAPCARLPVSTPARVRGSSTFSAARQPGNQMKKLEDETDLVPPHISLLAVAQLEWCRCLPGGRRRGPGGRADPMMLSRVDLPDPEGPMMDTYSPGAGQCRSTCRRA